MENEEKKTFLIQKKFKKSIFFLLVETHQKLFLFQGNGLSGNVETENFENLNGEKMVH